MTTEKVIRFTHKDLAAMSVKCAACGTEVSIDLSGKPPARITVEDRVLTCPVCGTQFDTSLKNALGQFSLAFAAAEASGQVVTFRVSMPAE